VGDYLLLLLFFFSRIIKDAWIIVPVIIVAERGDGAIGCKLRLISVQRSDPRQISL
jgi:hypothetical protein